MNYHNILTDNMVNGIGLRTVIWVSGCDHFCTGCFNSQTWDKHSGVLFNTEAKEELYNYLSQPHIDGITFSGGDPLHKNNISSVKELILEIKKMFSTKSIWIYTGYIYENLDKERMEVVNLVDVLIDGKFVQDLYNPNLRYCGSSNQRVINIPETNKQNMIVLYTKQ